MRIPIIKIMESGSTHRSLNKIAYIFKCDFLHEQSWILPWIKSIYNELNITFYVFVPSYNAETILVPSLHIKGWRHIEWCMSLSDELFRRSWEVLFLTRYNESINDNKNEDLYTSSTCLTRSVFVLMMTPRSIADDVIITRQLWCDHVNSDI